MSTTSTFSTTIQQIILNPSRGVVGLVDDLLGACCGHNIQLAWQDGQCRLSSSDGEWEDTIDLPIRRSVFRAILARVATLCNIQLADSVSPYGGTADLTVGYTPTGMLTVTIVNTPAEHGMRIAPRVADLPDGDGEAPAPGFKR
jgi:hypothetical protein